MNVPNATIFREAMAKLKEMRRPLLVSHRRPDGDAIGSLVAMHRVLSSHGADPTVLLFDPAPDRYSFLLADLSPLILGDGLSLTELSAFDGVVVLDTCSFQQLEPIADFLRTTQAAKVVFDHHVSRDDLGALCVIDESAAANCLILFEWAKQTGSPIDRETAGAMFVGVAMDTGWFRHSNTDQRVFSAVSELTSVGVEPYDIYRRLYCQEPATRLALLGHALANVSFFEEGRVAVMKLARETFSKTGATPLDTENIVENPLSIGRVLVSVLLVERDDGTVRISFRSKPPGEGSTADVDVAAIASKIGGGGHRRAAGATCHGSLDDAQEAVMAGVSSALENSVSSQIE